MLSSSTSPPSEPDVFVSFRGHDVRKNFIQYLIIWLNREGFSYFYDDESQHAGKRIEDKIFPAIHQARVALVVLSKNYADSKWCLNELVEILKCNSHPKNLAVIPIFYGVDPADVKNLPSESEFGQAFERLRKDKKNGQHIAEWEEALKEVKKFSGFELEKFGKEPDLLDKIVQSLCEKICPSQSLNFAKNAIGANRLVEDLRNLLRIGREDVRVIGISGREGIGKTTVAKALCEGTLREFERFILLDKVGEENENDLVGRQKKLIQKLSMRRGQLPYDSSPGYIEMIERNLGCKKILLVLDGVTKKEQMEKLGVTKRELFCPGSRILITARDPGLLKDLKVDDTFNVEGLNRDEAFRLFCRHAFKREEPGEGYEKLSRYLFHYAGGHPLALEKWGSFLYGQSIDKLQKLSDKLRKNPSYIKSIKTDFGPIFKEYPFKVVGPCGGDRRTESWKGKRFPGVTKIIVGFDSEGINFIRVQYDKGFSHKAVTHGTIGGETWKREIDIKDPSEYLTSVSGHTKRDTERPILQSLTFHGNRGKLAQIGTKIDGRKFSFPYTGGKIVGFHGSRNNSHLESIGAFYEPTAHTPTGYSSRVFGPFGGAGEKSWDSNCINGIFVRHAYFIKEITFEVREATSSKPRTTYGKNGTDFEVKLETQDEYITSFSGFFENAYDGGILIKSLTFRTNKRILGPIGREEGKHFSSPSPSKAMKVIGFFGRTDDHLESIGARVQPCYPFESVGLYGSSSPSNWDDYWDDRSNDCINVRKITVEFSPSKRFIRSISFCYEVENKSSRRLKRHLGIQAEVAEPCMIKIDQNQYLTSISGYYMDDGITSLTFGTNQRTLEPIGREEGIHFSSPVTGGKIVGFYGRSDKNLKAIGAYFKQVPHFYPIKSIGPFGGSSGETWDHRKFKGVREIEVKHGIDIHSIKFVYDDDGDQSYPVMYEVWAEKENPEVTTVKLDYPQEYFTSISGYTRDSSIQSLTFYSNKSRYGPYGKEMGKYFWYPSNGSRITGFYGTRDPDNKTLKSIGVYVELIPRMYPFKTVGPFGGFGKKPWDDGVHTDVRGFRISFDEAIMAIGIAYDNNGSFVSGSDHGMGYNNKDSFVLGLKAGKEHRDKYEEVLLDYPKERLISISVLVDKNGEADQAIIHDLKIFTTKAYYGPFVVESWQKRDDLIPFHIPSKPNCGRIVGFFGSWGRYLNSIGAHLEPHSD